MKSNTNDTHDFMRRFNEASIFSAFNMYIANGRLLMAFAEWPFHRTLEFERFRKKGTLLSSSLLYKDLCHLPRSLCLKGLIMRISENIQFGFKLS